MPAKRVLPAPWIIKKDGVYSIEWNGNEHSIEQITHSYVVPEPFTIEPTDSFSKSDIDEFVNILTQISKECYETPEVVRTAPHNAPIHEIKNYHEDDPEKAIYTWKQYKEAHNIK